MEDRPDLVSLLGERATESNWYQAKQRWSGERAKESSSGPSAQAKRPCKQQMTDDDDNEARS